MFLTLLLIQTALIDAASMAVKFVHKKNSKRRDVVKDKGPRAIPTYTTVAQGQYYAYGSGAQLEPRGGDYYSMEDECERRGTACWGFQTTFGCTDRLGCGSSLILADPSASSMIGTVGTTVYQAASQVWDEETDVCMGLTLDQDATVVGACETNCAEDDECEVYQWMSNDSCWRGQSNNCCPGNKYDDGEVLEGYRKQQVEWEEQLTQCMDLTEDTYVGTHGNCEGNCELDAECEVWQWFDHSSSCWRGKADKCHGPLEASYGGLKIIVDPNQCESSRRLLKIYDLNH